MPDTKQEPGSVEYPGYHRPGQDPYTVPNTESGQDLPNKGNPDEGDVSELMPHGGIEVQGEEGSDLPMTMGASLNVTQVEVDAANMQGQGGGPLETIQVPQDGKTGE